MRTVLYIGVTNDLERRMVEHKCLAGSKFAAKYHLIDLLYYERFLSMKDAIAREKQLKRWHREWKWNLIKDENPVLGDLSVDWFSEAELARYRLQIENGDWWR